MEQYNYAGSPLLDYKYDGHIEDWQGWQVIADELQDFVDDLQVEWDTDCVRGDGWEIYSDNIFNLYIAGLSYCTWANVEESFENLCVDEVVLNSTEFYNVIVKHWTTRHLMPSHLFELVVIFDVKTNRGPLTAKERRDMRAIDNLY